MLQINVINNWWMLKGSSCLMVHWMQQLTWDTARWFSCAHISRKYMIKLGTHTAFTWPCVCVCNGARMLQTQHPINGYPNTLSNRHSNKHRDAYPVTTFSNTNYFRANACVAYKHTCIVYKQTHLSCLQTNTPKLFTEYLSLEALNIEAVCPCWKDQERHHCDITFGSL